MQSYEAEDRAEIFVAHAFNEHVVDLGEIRMNYATAGSESLPALLLIPGQTESWWGYEPSMPLLAEHFHVHAIDLRGQGRSSWTPGRYTLDNLGNDVVRFIDAVIGRPTIVSGNSSGGILATWLSAYAKPGQIRGAVAEDPPFFASEVTPACGQSIRQAIGPLFPLLHKWVGDQWTIGDLAGMQEALPKELPLHVLQAVARMGIVRPPDPNAAPEIPQNLREYDPEWAKAFWSGTATVGCDHERMLASVRTPLLVTHHYRQIDPDTGALMGAVSDLQVARAGQLVQAAGQRFEVADFPEMTHAMHRDAPELFTQTVVDWSRSTLGAAAAA